MLSPSLCWAHSAERGLIMLLPTGFYIVAGALAVLASFILLSIVPENLLHRLRNWQIQLFSIPETSSIPWSLASFLLMALLLLVGIFGSTDPLRNALPLVFWTIWWVGFTSLQFLIGNLWEHLNPWSGPVSIAHRITRTQAKYTLPESVGYTPAILQFAGFAWYELIDLAPEDPTRLAKVIFYYWLFNFVAMMLFGERRWRERGEPFSILFRMVGGCSPVLRQKLPDNNQTKNRVQLVLAWPGKGLLLLPKLPITGILFVLLTLATVSVDGLIKTFTWFDLIGINPLDYPGRSAVQIENSLGLIVGYMFLVLAFFSSVYFGWRLLQWQTSSSVDQFQSTDWLGAGGRLVYSIVPISIGFHLAHYITVLLVNGQYAVKALADPFNTGAGVYSHDQQVTTSFLSNIHSVSLIWSYQSVVIVVGHIIGITMAHFMALELCEEHSNRARSAGVSQVFLVLFMIGYTIFGLWLLSTASVG